MNKKIFEPIIISGMTLKNRIGWPPLLNNPVTPDGGVNDKTIRWFESRAKGGAGLIMTGGMDPSAANWQCHKRGLALFDDRFIPGFTRLAKAVHSHGAKFGVQIGILGSGFSGPGMSS